MGEPIEVSVVDIVDAARANPDAPAAGVYRLAQARLLIEATGHKVKAGEREEK